jgi:hypothetical protein
VLRYTVLEMSRSGQPRLSPARTSRIAAFCDDGTATLVPWPDAALAQARLAAEGQGALVPDEGDEAAVAEARSMALVLPGAPYAADFSITLALSDLSECVLLCCGNGDAEAPAKQADPASAAEAQFQAAALALAKVRRAQAAAEQQSEPAARAAGWRRGAGVGSLLSHLRSRNSGD